MISLTSFFIKENSCYYTYIQTYRYHTINTRVTYNMCASFSHGTRLGAVSQRYDPIHGGEFYSQLRSLPPFPDGLVPQSILSSPLFDFTTSAFEICSIADIKDARSGKRRRSIVLEKSGGWAKGACLTWFAFTFNNRRLICHAYDEH